MPSRPLITGLADRLDLFPGRWQRLGVALGLAGVLVFPFVASSLWLTVGNLALVTIVGATALMVLTGFAGQISLGHAAFVALGAYTAAVLGTRWQVPFWLLLPLAGVAPVVVGLAAGVFALRLKGLYLAIVTLGLLFLVQHTLLSLPEVTRGLSGISVPMYTGLTTAAGAPESYADTTLVGPLRLPFDRKLYFLFLGVAVLVLWLVKNLARSATGRAMMAVRDHDLAASALGVDPARTKVLAFAISSYLAGVAGAMFAFQQQYITVEPPFDLLMSVQYIAMIVLGGLGTVWGAAAGAIAFVALTPLTERLANVLPFLGRLTSAQQSTVLFSLLVIGFLALEPLGLFGLWLRIKRYFQTWPFRY